MLSINQKGIRRRMRNILTPEQRDQFNVALKKSGLELLDDKKSILIAIIKSGCEQKL
jgi:Spy/CpxP family protein refolding chaperone